MKTDHAEELMTVEIHRTHDGRIVASIFTPTVPLSSPFTPSQVIDLIHIESIISQDIARITRTTNKFHKTQNQK